MIGASPQPKLGMSGTTRHQTRWGAVEKQWEPSSTDFLDELE